MGFSLDWHGKAVNTKVERACVLGINKTTTRAVKEAKITAPYVTGTYARSLSARNAVVRGKKIAGLWGSFDVDYALNVEMRHNTLRNAADKLYPQLSKNIKQELKKL